MLAQYWRMGTKARTALRSVQRYRFALACLQGFRPVAQYDLRDLDSRVVEDFRVSQWKMLHHRGDFLDQMERAEQDERTANHAKLGDVDAAKDVVNYVTQSHFGPAVPSVLSSKPAPVPSGRTRILSLT